MGARQVPENSRDFSTTAPAATRLPSAPSAARLMGDAAFHGLVATQFLGAFNDNLFKQVVLLLYQAVPSPDGGTRDMQALGLLLFALPFVLFSGYAGFLSDRFGKRRVIVLSKFAEIVIMVLGMGVFWAYGNFGLPPVLVMLIGGVLFLMGTQSAFFGPGKYGVLPELFRERDLPVANGVILMTTFLAIILGVAAAGALKELMGSGLWMVGAVCIGIAMVGTATSFALRQPPPANRGLPFTWDSLAIPRDMRSALRRDRPLLAAVVVSSTFWMCAAVVQPAVIAYGKSQLQQGDLRTSYLTAGISIGIAVGSLIAGYASRGGVAWGILRVGLAGMTGCLAFLAYWGGEPNNGRDLLVAAATLVILGGFTGMFAVPIQVFLQERAPDALKGRMIATVNLLNWVGILLAAGIYEATLSYREAQNLPPSVSFGWIAIPLLILTVAYHPRRE